MDSSSARSQLGESQGTKTELVLPEIRVVGNAFVSLMAYQAKGYAYICPVTEGSPKRADTSVYH